MKGLPRMATETARLFSPPRADGKLSNRQQHLLALIEDTDGGLTDHEAGAFVHALRDKHYPNLRCSWCADDGRAALQPLRDRGLIKFHPPTMRWVVQASDGDPATASIPY